MGEKKKKKRENLKSENAKNEKKPERAKI